MADILGGYAFKSKNYSSEGYRIIRISDFSESLSNEHKIYYPYDSSLKKYIIKNNDILIAMTGGTVGKSILLRNVKKPLLLNQRVGRIRANSFVLPKFLITFFKSPLFIKKVYQSKNSMNENISLKFLKNCEVPIPPLNEQSKIINIVEKVIQLL